jgi:hypothetical protein
MNPLPSQRGRATVETSANGNVFWYRDGNLHRDDGPAVEYADGTKAWYRDDQQQRDLDKADAINAAKTRGRPHAQAPT